MYKRQGCLLVAGLVFQLGREDNRQVTIRTWKLYKTNMKSIR